MGGIMSEFPQIYKQWQNNKSKFWGQYAQKSVSWFKEWDNVLDESEPYKAKYFNGALCNTCYNAVDRHVEAGFGAQTAIIYDSPITSHIEKISYSALQTRVAKLAGALQSLGLKKGDTAIIYMPMIPEGPIAMLACARIGVVHSVVFGGFASKELATRIIDCRPKAIITATCGLEGAKIIPYTYLIDEAIQIAKNHDNTIDPQIIIKKRPQHSHFLKHGEFDYDDLVALSDEAPCVQVNATDPLYILYTSGTTGQPKGVVRDNGGHMVGLLWSMENIYNAKPGEVFWAASDIGWVVGHSYIVYAPLLNRSTTIIYEGKPVGTPDAGAFWRVINQHQVKQFFTAPTAIRAIKKEDSQGEFKANYDTSCLQALFLAGERCDPDTLHWSGDLLKVPVIDHWWQTETGWSISANCLGLGLLPIKSGSPSLPVVGNEVVILDDHNQPVKNGEMGAICIKYPLAPGALTTLWNAQERYEQAYLKDYPGYYKTGDAGYIDDDGYVFVMSRMDDVINVAGHRLSTGLMEEVLSGHKAVAECAVMGVKDQLKGELPLGLIVLKKGVMQSNEEIIKELIAKVRDDIGAVAAFKLCVIVKRLPKTRSGKILRAVVRKIADGVEFSMPPTIDDPLIIDEIRQELLTIGYPKS